MSLQARFDKHDPRLYNVNRDLAHCFASVVMTTAKQIEDNVWQEGAKYLADRRVPYSKMGDACESFVTFVRSCADSPSENMADCLRRSGWFDVPEPAKVVYMAYLGRVLAGMFFVGAREATLGGSGPCLNLEALTEAGERSSFLISMSLLGRRWWKFKAWMRGCVNAAMGRSVVTNKPAK